LKKKHLANHHAPLRRAEGLNDVPPVRSFIKVVVPIMLPGIIAGGIIMWVTTLAELSTTIVLYYGPWATMTVEVFQRIGSGDFGPASPIPPS
jgi:iron(III) transport system permease protein